MAQTHPSAELAYRAFLALGTGGRNLVVAFEKFKRLMYERGYKKPLLTRVQDILEMDEMNANLALDVLGSFRPARTPDDRLVAELVKRDLERNTPPTGT